MQEKKYKEQPYRIVILITYLITALVNSLPVHTFGSINVAVEDIFQVSAFDVTLNALLFTIAHPLFAFPCNWLINRYGMRKSFIIGGVIVIAGVWMRLLLQVGDMTFCLIGSGLAAIGNIFVLNTPSKMAINWFKVQSVNMVTSTGILFTLISMTLGASIPGLLIDQINGTPQDVKMLLLYQACVITVPYIFLMILFRDHPTVVPSKAAKIIVNQQRENYKDLLKKLFSNAQYLKVMVAMSLGYGTLTATLVVLDQILSGLGYLDSGQTTSITILSAMTIGILGNPLFSILLKRTKAYRAVAGLNTFGGFFTYTMIVLAFLYKTDEAYKIMLLGSLVGFFLIPQPSVLIMYASQLVFPIDQSSSAGYLLASSQTFGFIVGAISINYIDRTMESSRVVLIVYSCLLLLSFIFSLIVKQDLKKYKFERESLVRVQSKITDSLIARQQN